MPSNRRYVDACEVTDQMEICLAGEWHAVLYVTVDLDPPVVSISIPSAVGTEIVHEFRPKTRVLVRDV